MSNCAICGHWMDLWTWKNWPSFIHSFVHVWMDRGPAFLRVPLPRTTWPQVHSQRSSPVRRRAPSRGQRRPWARTCRWCDTGNTWPTPWPGVAGWRSPSSVRRYETKKKQYNKDCNGKLNKWLEVSLSSSKIRLVRSSLIGDQLWWLSPAIPWAAAGQPYWMACIMGCKQSSVIWMISSWWY